MNYPWTHYLDMNHPWTHFFGNELPLDIYYLDMDYSWTYLIMLNMITAGYGLLDSSHYWTFDT